MRVRDGRATVTERQLGSQELARREPFHIGTHHPEEVQRVASDCAGPGSPPEVRRLLLVRHAPTGATRIAAFPADEPLDPRGVADARALRGIAPGHREVLSSPALRCLQTAEAAGLDARLDPEIAECDFGSWAGSTLSEVQAADPDGAEAWMVQPEAAPHGGEPLSDFSARIAAWLEAQAQSRGPALVVTHAGVIRAAVVLALGAPLQAFWRVDAAPLALTELHADAGRWTVTRVNSSLGESA